MNFGKFNPAEKITVVVFRDVDIGTVQQNDVEFTYNVNTTERDDTGLNLLDVSDFYGMFLP